MEFPKLGKDKEIERTIVINVKATGIDVAQKQVDKLTESVEKLLGKIKELRDMGVDVELK